MWENLWPGLSTGVRLVWMRIRKPISSYVTTHTAYITYRTQIRTCRYSVKQLHIGRACNEARKEQGHDTNSQTPYRGACRSKSHPSIISKRTNVYCTTNIQFTKYRKRYRNAIFRWGDEYHFVVTRSTSKKKSRPSSLFRLAFEGCTQVTTESSRTSSPASNKGTEENADHTSDFVYSDDSEKVMISPKRHQLQQSAETSFHGVKRKSRSRTHNSL